MIRRLYIDNYRCFRNFQLKLDDLPCSMIIGGNGVGKSTIAEVLSVFRGIGSGVADINALMPRNVRRVGTLDEVKTAGGKSDVVSLEIEVGDGESVWVYSLVFGSVGMKYEVVDETLMCGERKLFDRSQHLLSRTSVGLAVMADAKGETGIRRFQDLLKSIVVVRPTPRMMVDESMLSDEPLKVDCSNFASWIFSLLSSNTATSERFREYMTCVMPDFVGITRSPTECSGSALIVQFKTDRKDEIISYSFDLLSDGEKCQFVAGAMIASNLAEDNLVCFWDEPDNYITTAEIDNLLPALCNSFSKRGQLIVTSHSREAILAFGENEVLSFRRAGHIHAVLPPTSVKEMRARKEFSGSLDAALQSGKVVRG